MAFASKGSASLVACPYCGSSQEPRTAHGWGCRACGGIVYVIQHSNGCREHATSDRFEEVRRSDLTLAIQDAKGRRDWQELWTLCRQASRVLYIDGRTDEAYLKLREAHRYNLLHLESIGVKRVSISICEDKGNCWRCRDLNGQDFTVRQALRDPPLPIWHPDGRLCTCIYSGVFVDEPRRSR